MVVTRSLGGTLHMGCLSAGAHGVPLHGHGAESCQRETHLMSSSHHQSLLQQPAWMWNHSSLQVANTSACVTTHFERDVTQELLSRSARTAAWSADGNCRLPAAAPADRNPDFDWKKLAFGDFEHLAAAGGGDHRPVVAPPPPPAAAVLQLYGNSAARDDSVCNLTSLVNSCKAAVLGADDCVASCGDHPRTAAGARSFVPGCAELINGSALGVTSSIAAAAPKPSLFEFGVTGSCSTPSFCVAGSPVTVPVMPPPSSRPRHEVVPHDHGLIVTFDGGQHDAAASCFSPAGVVESDHSNVSSECLSFEDSTLSKQVDGPAYVQDPGNIWMQQGGRNTSFVDSDSFWMMPQAATMISDYESVHKPTPTSNSNSHFPEHVPFRMHPASLENIVPSGVDGEGVKHLADSVPNLHTVIGNGESSIAAGRPHWCAQQAAWIDQTMAQSSARQVAPPSACEGHDVYTKSRGRDGAENLNNTQCLSRSTAITRKRRNNEESVEQTCDESAVDEPGGGRLAGFMVSLYPELSKLGGDLASQVSMPNFEKFECIVPGSLDVSRANFDDETVVTAAASLLHGAKMASQQGQQYSRSQTTTFDFSESSSDLSPLIRAKIRRRHGTATDPQSIAARTRREKFSDRIRILQTLVPNGERLDTVATLGQTLEYVRFLQHQVREFYNGSNDHAGAAAAGGHDHREPAPSNMPEKWKQFKEHIISAQIVV